MIELRTRMIRDMALRGFSPRTHRSYIAAVVRLAKYYHRAPDQLSNDEVQAYLAYLIQERKLSWSTCSQAAHAFRFLYHVTLGHPPTDFHVPAPKQHAVCTTCGAERITYNSCRNRHCPKCQRVTTERWLAARQRELLPIDYFHVVFTLPHALNPLAQSHPRLIYRLLFQAAASTLLRFGRDPRHLGGEVGVTAVLHTWGQTLTQHVHVHCLVTGGALARDGTRWLPAHPGFLFPVRALAQVFRARYLAGWQPAFARGELHLTGGLASLAEPAAFAAWLAELRQHAWVVYCKPPFASPAHVLAYLSRYTHRVALSNDRLLALAHGRVRFRWRDYADGDRVKIMDLAVDEFLRRFLLHIVPDRFVRIRHFGLLANRRRAAALAQCRLLLAQPPPPTTHEVESVRALLLRVMGIDIERCPLCQRGVLQRRAVLPPLRVAWDTS